MHTVETYKAYLWGNYELLHAAKSKEAMCKHASLRPALHVQWEQTIVPHFSAGLFSASGDSVYHCTFS